MQRLLLSLGVRRVLLLRVLGVRLHRLTCCWLMCHGCRVRQLWSRSLRRLTYHLSLSLRLLSELWSRLLLHRRLRLRLESGGANVAGDEAPGLETLRHERCTRLTEARGWTTAVHNGVRRGGLHADRGGRAGCARGWFLDLAAEEDGRSIAEEGCQNSLKISRHRASNPL